MRKLIQKTELFKHDHVFTGYADGTPYLYNKTNNGVVDPYEEFGHADYGVYKTVLKTYQESFTSTDSIMWRNYSENNHDIHKLDINYVGSSCKINIRL